MADDLSLDHETVGEHLAALGPWGAPFVVIDVETTGLDSDPAARVVEIAAVRFDGRKPGVRFATRVNPGVPITAEAGAVHGITDADVADAPTFADVWPRIVALYDSPHVSTVAYSAAFDREFARREVLLASAPPPPLGLRRPWFDPLVWIREADRFVKGQGRHKLAATCARRRIALGTAHAAESDALAAGLLWLQLEREVRAFLGPGAVTHTTVLRMQSALAAEQDRRHAEFVERMRRADEERTAEAERAAGDADRAISGASMPITGGAK